VYEKSERPGLIIDSYNKLNKTMLVSKRFFIGALLLLTISFINAQRRVVDSLLHLLSSAKNDTDRLDIMFNLVDPYKNVNLDSGIYYAQQGVLLAKKFNDPHADAAALDNYGYALFNAGNYPDALKANLEALQQFQQVKDTAGIGGCYLHLGFVYRNMDEYRKAIEYFSKYKAIADYYNDDFMRLFFCRERKSV
jgi:tetratricopeptide (TPR) repeat protein